MRRIRPVIRSAVLLSGSAFADAFAPDGGDETGTLFPLSAELFLMLSVFDRRTGASIFSIS